MSARGVALGLLVALWGATSGCQMITALTYYLRPRQIQEPAYKFDAPSRVALFVEAARPGDENPVFNEALHERVTTMLREDGSKAELLPLRAVTDLRRANPDFERWNIQRIGRELKADYVLYLRLERLAIRETPEYPILTPAVDLRMKLIAVSRPGPHARVWPEAKEGYPVHCERQSTEVADANPDAADGEARKLGYDTAYYVAMPFVKVDLEEPPPVER